MIHGIWLDRTEFEAGLLLQEHYSARSKKNQDIYILGLEHPEVITLGIRGDAKRDLIYELQSSSPEVFKIDRGGQATLHSPGQLVIYPIVPLRVMKLGVSQFIDSLLEATRLMLLKYQVKAQKSGSGLYTENGKIAFVGLRIVNGISKHGISINVYNDIELFGKIRSCGVADARIDRMSADGRSLSLEMVFKTWFEEFERCVDTTNSIPKNLLKSAAGLDMNKSGQIVTASSLSVVGSALP